GREFPPPDPVRGHAPAGPRVLRDPRRPSQGCDGARAGRDIGYRNQIAAGGNRGQSRCPTDRVAAIGLACAAMMVMSNGLGLLGGSFNPIHFGHLIGARAVAERLQLSKVLLIPAAIPPHKQTARLAAADQRLAMARLAVEGDSLFEVSDIELGRSGPSYTF